MWSPERCRNFLDCVKSRKQPVLRAYRERRMIAWDPKAERHQPAAAARLGR